MDSLSLRHRLPEAWRSALIGAVASLPVAGVLNWLPNSEATIGGGVMILGAFIAGVVAVTRSTDPDAAGLRTGFLGGVLAVLTLIVTVAGTAASGSMAAWPLSRVVFWIFASGLVLCIAPVFGLVCGRAGGWVATTVGLRGTMGTNAS